MKITGVELRRIRLPLVVPFRTSFGEETDRKILLVRVATPDAEGWGECVALGEPVYSPEYLDGAQQVIERFLLPALLAAADVKAEGVAPALAFVKGNPMAKAAVETAILDAQLRAAGTSFASYLGATRTAVDAGVSVGIFGSIGALLDAVAGYLDAGYRRIKLKIEPGWDIEPVRAVRERFGEGVLLQVDANTAYTLADADHLAKLDPFDLVLIEQPFAADDLLGHAALAAQIGTPVCLDESIESARDAELAISMGACSVVNIKPGRVGGYLEARRIHDLCAAHGVPVWCGGMLESGVGRAANVALAAMENFTLPGDTSASDRYFREDITEPFELVDGRLIVPSGPGIGVSPRLDVLESVTESVSYVSPH